MKKKTVIIISALALAVLLIINFSTVRIIGDKVTARYIYGDKNIITELSDEDAKTVTKIRLILPHSRASQVAQ